MRCQIFGHTKKEPRKWAGEIALYNGDEYHRPILTSGAVFDSEEACLEAMRDTVKNIREAHERGEIRDPLDDLPKDSQGVIGDIVEGARG